MWSCDNLFPVFVVCFKVLSMLGQGTDAQRALRLGLVGSAIVVVADSSGMSWSHLPDARQTHPTTVHSWLSALSGIAVKSLTAAIPQHHAQSIGVNPYTDCSVTPTWSCYVGHCLCCGVSCFAAEISPRLPCATIGQGAGTDTALHWGVGGLCMAGIHHGGNTTHVSMKELLRLATLAIRHLVILISERSSAPACFSFVPSQRMLFSVPRMLHPVLLVSS